MDSDYIPQGKIYPALIRKIFGERRGTKKRVRLVIDIQEPTMVFQDVSDELNLVFTNSRGSVFIIPMFAVTAMYPEKIYPLEYRTRSVGDRRSTPETEVLERAKAIGGSAIKKIFKDQEVSQRPKR